jgi:dihydroorotate dehydrogenase electron transfer subunit
MFDQDTEIIFNREIKPGIYLMGLRSSQIALESRPGQFVMVRVNEGIDPLLRRPFSICGVSDKGDIRILYKIVGHGTEILAGKKAGEKLSVLGPLGQGFSLSDDNKKAILVAGGMGIAPLLFLAGALKGRPMTFMAGFGSSRDVIPFQDITDQPMDISIATDDGSEGYAGLVTGLLDAYLDQNTQEKNAFTIYTCGPLPMLRKVSAIAHSHNISCQVSLESLMACGLGACQGCAVKIISQDNMVHYRHVCKDGPVFPSNTIDWSKI